MKTLKEPERLVGWLVDRGTSPYSRELCWIKRNGRVFPGSPVGTRIPKKKKLGAEGREGRHHLKGGNQVEGD